MKYYKFLTETGDGPFTQFSYKLYLPDGDEPGPWLSYIPGRLRICQSGYHIFDAMHIIRWRNSHLYEVECKKVVGSRRVHDDKYTCHAIRFLRKINSWNEMTVRLFLCWTVRRFWDKIKDVRCKKAVEVMEQYAKGEVSITTLKIAHQDALESVYDARKILDFVGAEDKELAIEIAAYIEWITSCPHSFPRLLDRLFEATLIMRFGTTEERLQDTKLINKHLAEMLGLEEVSDGESV